MKPKKRRNIPKYLHRASVNPNSTHQRVTVAISNANKGRTIKPISLATPPWVMAQDEQQEAAHG